MKNILVVDDNKTNLIAAKYALSDIYKITAVLSGEQALTFLKNNTPDLILLDINMPQMDGFEVLNQIQLMEGKKDIPVVFLTADNDADTENKCLELGAQDFIAKPFVTNVMRARIARILELEDLRSSLADRLDQKILEVQQMKNKSAQDPLCGLWNKAYVAEQVNEIIKSGRKGTLFMMDMDNFKAINDTYGHLAGDNTLKMFADTLRDNAGDGDIPGRIGGDEFVMYIDGQRSKTEIENLANNIINDMCYKIEQCKYETNTSVSVGISQIPEDGEDFDACFLAADKALYYVKQNGKNAYRFFSESKQIQSEKAGSLVDLKYLKEIMDRADSNNGAYMLDYDNFRQVYHFIRRFVERSNRDVQTLLFTAEAKTGSNCEVDEIENALELLEKAIFYSLRRADVSTRYSSKQVVVILMDANTENGDAIAKRILNEFSKLYLSDRISVEYSIAKMNGKNEL